MDILIGRLKSNWVLVGVLVSCSVLIIFYLSSVKAEETLLQENIGNTELESGAWLWTSPFKFTPEYRDYIINSAKENGITSIYVSIESYIYISRIKDEVQRERYKMMFVEALGDFIIEAHRNNISVDAVVGTPNWVEEKNINNFITAVEFVKEFNKTHTEKLRGLQFDIEPYVHELYQNNKKLFLQNYLMIIKESVGLLEDTNIELSVAIPEFYDGQNGLTPKFFFDGRYEYTFGHLLRVLDRKPGSKILIMAYRTKSLGDNGSLDISKDEISQANKSKTKIIIAQEVGDVLDSNISFYGMSKTYYEEQLEIIKNAVMSNKSYGGTATHYLDALLKLK